MPIWDRGAALSTLRIEELSVSRGGNPVVRRLAPDPTRRGNDAARRKRRRQVDARARRRRGAQAHRRQGAARRRGPHAPAAREDSSRRSRRGARGAAAAAGPHRRGQPARRDVLAVPCPGEGWPRPCPRALPAAQDPVEVAGADTLREASSRCSSSHRRSCHGPKVLLVDELSLGLAPIVVTRLVPTIEACAASGIGVLLIEQFAHLALSLAKTAYVLEEGASATTAPPRSSRAARRCCSPRTSPAIRS